VREITYFFFFLIKILFLKKNKKKGIVELKEGKGQSNTP
jgi:hypothetical protein